MWRYVMAISVLVTCVVQKVEMCDGQLYVVICDVHKRETCDGQLYGWHLCGPES
jgi:hypothetical protein